VLDQEKKFAHRGRLPAPDSGSSISFEPTLSDIGTRAITGVLARGCRRTVTIPKNAPGNDRDLVITTETWTSPELQITMFMETQDLRVGDTTLELENISRADPDRTLFAPPADSRIVDENAEFTVTGGAQPPPPPRPPPPRPVPPARDSPAALTGPAEASPLPCRFIKWSRATRTRLRERGLRAPSF